MKVVLDHMAYNQSKKLAIAFGSLTHPQEALYLSPKISEQTLTANLPPSASSRLLIQGFIVFII
eukprot:c30671_g1_i1 orf=185-376(+)